MQYINLNFEKKQSNKTWRTTEQFIKTREQNKVEDISKQLCSYIQNTDT